MKGSAGILLVAVGVLLLYVILSDKYQCFITFFDCMTGADLLTPKGYTAGGPQTATPPIVPQSGSSWWGQILPEIFNQKGEIDPFRKP